MNQLTRIIRNESAGSPDEQAAAPDERGSYGELMEEIDRLLEPTAAGNAFGSSSALRTPSRRA